MTRVLNISLEELSSQHIDDLRQAFGDTTEVEIHLQGDAAENPMFSEAEFWSLIDSIDWSAEDTRVKLEPVVQSLAAMPISSICLFADWLSKLLYKLDTRAHALAYAIDEPDGFVSADDFLYARCAVVAEGKDYYEQVLRDSSLMPNEITFEPLLYLADDAFEVKMGIPFNYRPAYNYETRSNEKAWLVKA